MARAQHSKIGVTALIAYTGLTVATAVALFELGSTPLGYSSLSSRFVAAPVEDKAAAQRYGKMWVRSDHAGRCREYSLDNKTQQIVPSGTVVCDQEQFDRYNQRSRTEIIRDAFRGQ